MNLTKQQIMNIKSFAEANYNNWGGGNNDLTTWIIDEACDVALHMVIGHKFPEAYVGVCFVEQWRLSKDGKRCEVVSILNSDDMAEKELYLVGKLVSEIVTRALPELV